MIFGPLCFSLSDFRFLVKVGFALSLACGLVGCEDGPAIAPVTGIVTHDGVPLANAKVEFQPDKGAPSYAITEKDGSYDLKYKLDRRGALLGRHYVSVVAGGEITDPETGDTRVVPETVPRAYNEETAVEFHVEKGDNVFDVKVEGKRKPGPNRGF